MKECKRKIVKLNIKNLIVKLKTKGIILAGGLGSRLHPATQAVSKHLLLVYNKPIIYYPLSVLMLAGIREILIITTPQDQINFRRLLGNGENFGINIKYMTQSNPKGIAEAFIIGEEFIGRSPVCLCLGDNIFYGQGLTAILKDIISKNSGATIFATKVNNPMNFGIVEFKKNKIISINEKPKKPKSEYAITGLYFYDNDVINISKKIKLSKRGELEITTVNQKYLKKKKLKLKILGRGTSWFDTGTPDSLYEASSYVHSVEKRSGKMIACIEEIALIQGWISKKKIYAQISKLNKNLYNDYLLSIIKD